MKFQQGTSNASLLEDYEVSTYQTFHDKFENLDEVKRFNNDAECRRWWKENFKVWENELTDLKRISILKYASDDFSAINAYLRGETCLMDENHRKLIEWLDKSLKVKEIPESVSVFRGGSIKSLGRMHMLPMSQWVGKKYSSCSYTSASIYENDALDYVNDVIFEIILPKGTTKMAYLGIIEGNVDENEVLLSRDFTFEILNVSSKFVSVLNKEKNKYLSKEIIKITSLAHENGIKCYT